MATTDDPVSVAREPWEYDIPTDSDLREMRKACDLTAQEVADAVGCSGSHITKIECGASQPSLRVLTQLLQVYASEWPREEVSADE